MYDDDIIPRLLTKQDDLKAENEQLRAALMDADRVLELAGYEVLPGNVRDKIRALLNPST